jgi:hypothetical protein
VASLVPVAAGFTIVPSRDRERAYVRDLAEHEQYQLPLDGALFEIRLNKQDEWVVLVPFRSYDAASRVLKAFEQGAKDHGKTP